MYDFIILTERPEEVSWLIDKLPNAAVVISPNDWASIPEAKIYLTYYYGKIINEQNLTLLRGKNLFNLHNSLLPKYRGFHAFSWAIESGENSLGYSIHSINPKVDTGDLAAQISFNLDKNCDVNCAFRIGNNLLKIWLPETLLELISSPTRSLIPQKSISNDFTYKKRSGPFGYFGSLVVDDVKNSLRASNPPYGKGIYIEKTGKQKIFMIDSSPESSSFLKSHNQFRSDVLFCLDGFLNVFSCSSPTSEF
jgi:methionyl-tRNA formyltransferase